MSLTYSDNELSKASGIVGSPQESLMDRVENCHLGSGPYNRSDQEVTPKALPILIRKRYVEMAVDDIFIWVVRQSSREVCDFKELIEIKLCHGERIRLSCEPD
jgi:hypothetical protein